MSSINITHTFTSGTTAQASQVNQNFTDVKDVVNGDIDNSNIAASAAIAGSKLNIANILTSASTTILGVGNTGDTNPRAILTSDGVITFGPGNAVSDVILKRSAAGELSIRNLADSAFEDLKCDALTLNTALTYANGGTGLSTLGTAGQVLTVNSGATALEYSSVGGGTNGTFNARLTLESGVAISTSDQTAKTTVYLTKHEGNQIGVWNGSGTDILEINGGEISASLSGLTADLPYDVFCYDSDSGGDIDTLEVLAWSDASNRATALAMTDDGYYAKTGALGRRYCGTILITSTTGQCEDSTKFRGVFNAYNRVNKSMYAVDTTDSWTYDSSTLRASNANTTLGQNKITFIIGLSKDPVKLRAMGSAQYSASGVKALIGIGVDSTSSNSAQVRTATHGYSSGGDTMMAAEYTGFPAVGSHSAYKLEALESGTTAKTFWGDDGGIEQAGLIGEVMA